MAANGSDKAAGENISNWAAPLGIRLNGVPKVSTGESSG
jgi:hypothetical protein